MTNLDKAIICGVKENKFLSDIYAGISGVSDKIDFYRAVLKLIEQKEIPNVLICCCGHDCSKCLTFRATLFDDHDMRIASAAFYKNELNQDLPADAIHCFGGKSDEIMEGCSQCPYTKCCKEKGLNGCSECPEYPCQMLGWYMEKYVYKVNQV